MAPPAYRLAAGQPPPRSANNFNVTAAVGDDLGQPPQPLPKPGLVHRGQIGRARQQLFCG
jgi:hypothetical protein